MLLLFAVSVMQYHYTRTVKNTGTGWFLVTAICLPVNASEEDVIELIYSTAGTEDWRRREE